ncbi:Mo-dependent nitrogenase C-terminal domain-containing protein [Nodosilinea nodulosa]|uniref:Mo-dependent nitrogenase C-terminal domain-containing protein n=1 Tax=Nodosilinea nodulosa TaxID=416001 RepID=UPI0002F8454C|nr:Mo-dependent nitrogenase C-terminal domain-containing protein [Nodosilinea nodulosa]
MALLTDSSHPHIHSLPVPRQQTGSDIWNPLRRWIDQIEVSDRRLAHLLCRVIPCCCPFERDISLLGRTVQIPALCELNPVYNELVGLRFRSLSHLADDCGEDVTRYIC